MLESMTLHKLLLKTHSITGLKYLCVTQKRDHERYRGSGVYWKRHLKRYGVEFKTELLYESDDLEQFSRYCAAKSRELNVVDSDEYANLVHEDGHPGTHRRERQLVNHWTRGSRADEISARISEKKRLACTEMSLDLRREMTKAARAEITRMRAEGHSFAGLTSEPLKRWHAGLTDEQRRSRGDKISSGRKLMSDEAKLTRKQKVIESYEKNKESRQRVFEEMRTTRLGANNPYAKSVVIEGVEYGSMKEAERLTGLSYSKIRRMRDA